MNNKNLFYVLFCAICLGIAVASVFYSAQTAQSLRVSEAETIKYYDLYEGTVEGYYDLLEQYEGLYNEDYVPDTVDYPNPSYFELQGKDL